LHLSTEKEEPINLLVHCSQNDGNLSITTLITLLILLLQLNIVGSESVQFFLLLLGHILQFLNPTLLAFAGRVDVTPHDQNLPEACNYESGGEGSTEILRKKIESDEFPMLPNASLKFKLRVHS
jgi:hypothetical protein